MTEHTPTPAAPRVKRWVRIFIINGEPETVPRICKTRKALEATYGPERDFVRHVPLLERREGDLVIPAEQRAAAVEAMAKAIGESFGWMAFSHNHLAPNPQSLAELALAAVEGLASSAHT